MKTQIKEIVQYWENIKSEHDMGVDWTEAHEQCWRCGYKSILQRCHIIPASLGGIDHPSNLVLLCSRCHREAPNHNNPKYMWLWINNTCTSLYDTYWTLRGMEEFEKIFKRKLFSGLDVSKVDLDKISELIKLEIKRTTIHYGEGRLNPSTIACMFAEIEEKLIQNSSRDFKD